jgi:hypothetical protein
MQRQFPGFAGLSETGNRFVSVRESHPVSCGKHSGLLERKIDAQKVPCKRKAHISWMWACHFKSATPIDINRGLTNRMFVGVIKGRVFKLSLGYLVLEVDCQVSIHQ